MSNVLDVKNLDTIKMNVTPRCEMKVEHAKIIDVEKQSLVVELTGTEAKLEAFIELLDNHEILELARTGIAGLTRGMEDIFYVGTEKNRKLGADSL